MNDRRPIPVFTLYGETAGFTGLVHAEALHERSAPNNWKIRAHRHADLCQLFLIEQGHAEASLDSQRVDASAQTFLFIPAQVVHAISFTPETEGTVFSFPARNLGSIGPAAQMVEQALTLPFSGPLNEELRMYTSGLLTALNGSGSFRNHKIVGLSNAILARLAEISETQTARPVAGQQLRMEQLSALVRQHMEDGWSVADYAAALSVSSGHLSRICRAATGQGAQAHIEGIIMDEACRYLTFTDLPVAEIGYRTGFFDPSYFSKRFRATRGMSPRMYRAQSTTGEVEADGID